MTTHECIQRLVNAGISVDDALALRRIAMTLHRWYEWECGNGDDYSSWCIVRGYKSGGNFEYDDGDFGHPPYIERHYHRGDARTTYSRIPDRERGAEKRLAKIMARYPGLSAYLQTDCRGAPLYIMRPGDVKNGADVSSCYSNGIAVYR